MVICHTKNSMLPVYSLSILLNGLAGFILIFGKEEAETGALALSFNNETIRLIIGVLAFVTGILKILSPMKSILVVGDLFPALAGLAGGFILAFEFYIRRKTVHSLPAEQIGELIRKYRKITGLSCITAAALHLFFYPIIFL